MTTNASSSTTGTGASPHTRGGTTVGRLPGALVAAGGVLFIAGVAFPIIADVFDNLGDTAAIRTALESDPAQWDVASSMSGVGALLAAVGLWLLGRRTSRVAAQPRARTAATVAGWFGLATAAWLVVAAYRVLASPAALAEHLNGSAGWDLVTGGVWGLGMLGAFVGIGLMLIWLPHLRVAGWLILVFGSLLALTGIILPVLPYFGLTLAGVVLALAPPRGHPAAP